MLLPGVPGAIVHIYDGELYALEMEVKDPSALLPFDHRFRLEPGEARRTQFQGIESLLKAGKSWESTRVLRCSWASLGRRLQ